VSVMLTILGHGPALPHQVMCEQLAFISQLKWQIAHIHHALHFYYWLEIGIHNNPFIQLCMQQMFQEGKTFSYTQNTLFTGKLSWCIRPRPSCAVRSKWFKGKAFVIGWKKFSPSPFVVYSSPFHCQYRS